MLIYSSFFRAGHCFPTAHLFLQGNALSGPIPTSMGSLSTLIDLRLSENSLIGTIPTEFAGLVRLENLYLSDNKLTGVIPPLMFNSVTRLMELCVAGNQLKGSLPTSLGKLGDLSTYDNAAGDSRGPWGNG